MSTHATIVRLSTSLGDIDINLYDELTPITVENFLSYVNNQSYENSYIHRSVTGFIIQGGGYTYTAETGEQEINSAASITNEPYFSNIRGTIAMAKLSDNPNSATNQWFLNLSDNAANLDNQNGGFTVFGQVMLDDMDVADDIASLGKLDSLPLRNYTQEDLDNGVEITDQHLVMITSVTIVDNNIDTLNGETPVATSAKASSSGGGGSTSIITLLIIALFSLTNHM